jgi:predicted MPP superfamily phosphohydrolase
MEELRRWAPPLTVIALTLTMHWILWRRLTQQAALRASSWLRWMSAAILGVASCWMILAVPYLMGNHRINLPSDTVSYLVAGSLFWVLLVASLTLWAVFTMPQVLDPSRRRLLALAAPVAAAPVLSAAFGIRQAREPLLVEVDIPVRGLPKDLDGLRIAQLTDIHYGPFFGRSDLERAVALANETKPHLTVVTGDLITRHGDDLDSCLQVLRGLKAEAGVFGCHGNHEVYAGAVEYATRMGARQGLRFLRGEESALMFGKTILNVAGHDYQRVRMPYLRGGEALVRPGAFNLLLQHNPDVFLRAAELGFDLTLAGHTHGGQINVEILNENVNVARFFTPFVRGRYEQNGKQLYVSSGLGTVAVPMRLGAPPEVTRIRLCAV